MSETYAVQAKRWAEGWELHIDGLGVTQVRTLDNAVGQARDYVETLLERELSDADFVIMPELGGLEDEVKAARAEVVEAVAIQRRAAEHSRAVARKLRASGLSVTDSAVVMGVSRGRVSQLVNQRGPQPPRQLR